MATNKHNTNINNNNVSWLYDDMPDKTRKRLSKRLTAPPISVRSTSCNKTYQFRLGSSTKISMPATKDWCINEDSPIINDNANKNKIQLQYKHKASVLERKPRSLHQILLDLKQQSRREYSPASSQESILMANVLCSSNDNNNNTASTYPID